MKVDIRLAISGCRKKGFMAGLEADEGAEQIEICLRSSARSACLLAAQRLHSLADRFERLAREEKPESGEAQLRINSGARPLEQTNHSDLSEDGVRS